MFTQSRVDTIRHHSACVIQRRARGIQVRARFRQTVLDKMRETKERKAANSIVRWYRDCLRKRGLTQAELE